MEGGSRGDMGDASCSAGTFEDQDSFLSSAATRAEKDCKAFCGRINASVRYCCLRRDRGKAGRSFAFEITHSFGVKQCSGAADLGQVLQSMLCFPCTLIV